MLQAQKLIELEGTTGTEVEVEEEPEGESIVGSGREAPRPPGMNIVHFFNKLSLFLGRSEQQSPWESFILGALLAIR